MTLQVLAQYILLADDTMSNPNFATTGDWTPQLYSYQQTAFNVLYFSFINPQTMPVVPKAFSNLAKGRGSPATGSVPSTAMIVFAIGNKANKVLKHRQEEYTEFASLTKILLPFEIEYRQDLINS